MVIGLSCAVEGNYVARSGHFHFLQNFPFCPTFFSNLSLMFVVKLWQYKISDPRFPQITKTHAGPPFINGSIDENVRDLAVCCIKKGWSHEETMTREDVNVLILVMREMQEKHRADT